MNPCEPNHILKIESGNTGIFFLGLNALLGICDRLVLGDEKKKKWTIADLIKNSIHFFQVQHVHLGDHHVVRKRSIDQNLRIKLYYDESVYK